MPSDTIRMQKKLSNPSIFTLEYKSFVLYFFSLHEGLLEPGGAQSAVLLQLHQGRPLRLDPAEEEGRWSEWIRRRRLRFHRRCAVQFVEILAGLGGPGQVRRRPAGPTVAQRVSRNPGQCSQHPRVALLSFFLFFSKKKKKKSNRVFRTVADIEPPKEQM